MYARYIANMRFSYSSVCFSGIYTCILLLLIMSSLNVFGGVTFEEKVIRAHTGGWTDLLEKYHKQSIIHLLDLTKDEFGPYEIKFIDKESSWLRVQEEIAQGRYAHMEITTELKPANDKKVIHLPFKNLHGLVGLRRLIIKKDKSYAFSNIQSFDDFKKFRAGQVVYWPDNRIYQHALIPLAHSLDYEKIFPMLDNNRFDYLPLGILEADDTLTVNNQYADRFRLLEDVYIFYPMKTFISVSVENVPLVNRLVKGLVLFKEEEQALDQFNHYFQSFIRNINADKALLVILHNPDFSSEANEAVIQGAIQQYFSDSTRIIGPNF